MEKIRLLKSASSGQKSPIPLPILTPLIFKGVPQSWPEFGNYKELNIEKNKISDIPTKIYIRARDITNPYELVKSRGVSSFKVPRYPVISRAYYKLWEILHEFPLIDNNCTSFLYAGLAEGPGGFLQAVHDYVYNLCPNCDHASAKFYGITLRTKDSTMWDHSVDHSVDIAKSNKASGRSEKTTSMEGVKISYGDPHIGDGNLLNPRNIIAFKESIPKVNLVTADGGIGLDVGIGSGIGSGIGGGIGSNNADIENFKEQIHLQLFYNEIVTALSILKKGGHFVLKIYDIFTIPTAQLLRILTDYFETVFITKPVTSRPASSEKYIVCLKFSGISDDTIKTFIVASEYLFENFKELPQNESDIFIHSFGNVKFSRQLLSVIKSKVDPLIKNQLKTLREIFQLIKLKKLGHGYDIAVKEYYGHQIRNAVAWCKKYKIKYFDKLESLI